MIWIDQTEQKKRRTKQKTMARTRAHVLGVYWQSEYREKAKAKGISIIKSIVWFFFLLFTSIVYGNAARVYLDRQTRAAETFV